MKITSDYLIYGSSAERLESIKNKYSIDYIDSYVLCSLLGFRDKVEAEVFKDSSSKVITIPRSVIIRRKDKIDFIEQLIAINVLDSMDQNELVMMVFSDESNYSELRQNLTEKYFAGGISILEEMLKENKYSDELQRIYEFVTEENFHD